MGGLLSSSCVWLPTSTPSGSVERSQCLSDSNFIFVPAGPYINGSDQVERDYGYAISAAAIASTAADIPAAEAQLRQRGWFDPEAERSIQELAAFCIGRDLVTNQEYQAFIMATGHRSPGISPTDYQRQGFLVHPYSTVEAYLWQGPQYPAGQGDYPVVLVSYPDAIAYATWKSQQDSRDYRLPTAPEWEKAARGTDGRYFPWGSIWNPQATNWAGTKLLHTSAINQFPLSRSVYGVNDMAGNVFEFTASTRSGSLERRQIMKGCSWDDLPGFCRAAYQHSRPADSRHILFGFRLLWQATTP